MAVTNTPDKSEMKAVERFERWLAYVKDDGDWAEEPDLDEFAIILALAKSASSRPPADQVPDVVVRGAAKALLDKIDADSSVRWKFFNECASLRAALTKAEER